MSEKVFVTYAWNSDERSNEKVFSFVDFLRKKGFEAECDKNKTNGSSASSFTGIMNAGLRYPKVIVILSETYKRKAEADSGGVGIEYKIISDEIGKNTTKYILVSFEGVSESVREKIVPILYRSYEIIDIKKDEDNDFFELFSKLLGKNAINFSPVAKSTPKIEPIILSEFTLKDKKKDSRRCRGFGSKEEICDNLIDPKKYKLCKDCFLEDFRTQIYNIYSAQGYDMIDYSESIFIATLHYGIITTKVLVGVGIYYNEEFDSQCIYKLDQIKSKISIQIDKTHLIVNRSLDFELKQLTERLNIEVFSENELTKKMIDLTNYFTEFIKDYENNPLKDHYIPMSDMNDNSLMKSVLDFINNDKDNAQLILGEYGSGKTSFCMRLTYLLIKQIQKNKSSYIPIFILLKDYSKSSIDELLTNFFINKYRINNGSISTFKQLQKYRKVLLIFDGFDEVAKRVDYEIKFRVFTEICKYATGNTKILLTCRPNYFQDVNEYADIFKSSYLHFEPIDYNQVNFKDIYIKEFNHKQIINFINSYSEELMKNGIHIQEFYKIIRTTHDLWDLSKRPFLLSIIIKTLPSIICNAKKELNDDQNLSINAANLYEAYTNDWLKREDNKGKTLIKAEDKKMFCEHLAFKMFTDNNFSIYYKDMPNEIKLYFNKLHDINDIDYFSHDIRSCSFLSADGNGKYSFIHNSFMEFFVAKIIVQKICNIYQKLSGITTPQLETVGEINNVLGVSYITTEICLFISDLLSNLEREKDQIRNILENNIKGINNIAKKNSLSILAKTDINIGTILSKMCIGTKSNINLSGIDLSYAKIYNADLFNLDFSRASFYNSKIQNVSFNCQFVGAKFQKSIIRNSEFFGEYLELTDWSYSRLFKCNFHKTNLASSKFENTVVKECDFQDAEFTDMLVNEKTRFVDCMNMESVIGVPYSLKY